MYKMRKCLFVLFLILSSFLSLHSQSMKLVFRYDDFILKNDSLDQQIVRVFQQHHIPLVLAVIPCDVREVPIIEKSYSFISTLQNGVQNKSIEIALHGLTHQRLAAGEFDNLSFEEQKRRIVKGKTFLESTIGTSITTFVPPFNAYDLNTLKVLQETGFKGLSASLYYDKSFNNPFLSYYPQTLEDFDKVLQTLNQNKKREGIVVVMFHHYTFKKNFTLTDLDELLSQVNSMKYIKCVTFQDLYRDTEVSDKKRMEANLQNNFLTKYLHINGMIYSTQFLSVISFFNIIIYSLSSIVLYLLVIALFYSKVFKMKLVTISMGILLLIFTILTVSFHVVAPLKLFAMNAFLSIAFAVICILIAKKKNGQISRI